MIGLTAVAAALIHAGAGAVAGALEQLHVSGLALLVLLHLPIVVLMGLAWRLASGDEPPASPSRFVWARFVRDAAAEILPFLQLGGVLFGVRALGRGRAFTLGTVSTCIDGLIELTAKLPYVLAALLTLLALGAPSHFTRWLSLALAATGLGVAILLLARRSLATSLEALVRAARARWPAVLEAGAVGPGVQASFDRILSQRGRLGSGFALHLIGWCLGAVEVWFTLRLLGVELTLAQALALDGTVAGLRTFGCMIPAAAGVQELSYMLGAALLGIPPADALAASFARRARDIVLGAGTLGIAAVRLWAPRPAVSNVSGQ